MGYEAAAHVQRIHGAHPEAHLRVEWKPRRSSMAARQSDIHRTLAKPAPWGPITKLAELKMPWSVSWLQPAVSAYWPTPTISQNDP